MEKIKTSENKYNIFKNKKNKKKINYSSTSNFLITFAGFPTAIELSSISLLTTEPAPIITLLPIVTPGRIATLPPAC